MIFKIIDYYIDLAGAMGLVLALGIILYTLYQLIIRKNLLSLLILFLLGLLFFIKVTNRILVISAIIILYIQLGYYVYFMIRGFFVKNKLPRKTSPVSPNITILIPVKNESTVIIDTLFSISQIDYPQSKLNTIVIDDGSTDNTYDAVTSFTHIQNLKIIRHPVSLGKANSINEVLSEINSEYVLIIDADHWIDKNFLKNALPLFTCQDIVCVQGKNVIRNGSASLLSRLVEMEYEERYEIIMNGRGLPQFMGSAGLFNTRLLKKMNGFDPAMLTEDFELSHRAYLEGYKIVFDSSLKTYELGAEDFKNFFVQRHRWFRGNWRTLIFHFKGLFTSPKISFANKIEIIDNYVELAALTCYLLVSILFLLDFINVNQFHYKSLSYIPMLSLFLLHTVTIINSKKYKLFLFLILIPFYYILYGIPSLMALLDNWILKSEYKWNKVDRSAVKDRGAILIEKEVATAKYNET